MAGDPREISEALCFRVCDGASGLASSRCHVVRTICSASGESSASKHAADRAAAAWPTRVCGYRRARTLPSSPADASDQTGVTRPARPFETTPAPGGDLDEDQTGASEQNPRQQRTTAGELREWRGPREVRDERDKSTGDAGEEKSKADQAAQRRELVGILTDTWDEAPTPIGGGRGSAAPFTSHSDVRNWRWHR